MELYNHISEPNGRQYFNLPSSSYATMAFRELTKSSSFYTDVPIDERENDPKLDHL